MRPRNLNLDLVRTFTTVVDAGTVTEAARQLAYSQSAVSMQLQRLEERVGHVLLRRTGHSVEMTAEGEVLLAHARQLLALNDRALSDLNTRPVSGVVRLGVATDYTYLLPRVLARFAQLYPLVELEVHNRFSVDLVEEIRTGSLDLAIVTRQRNSPGGKVLLREPLIWVTGRWQQPVMQDTVPLALYPEGKDIFREIAMAALQTAGRNWRIVYTGESLGGLRPALSTGLAVAVITRSMLTLTSDLRELDASSGLPELPAVEIALHHAPGRPGEPARRLTELIEQQLAAGSGSE